MKKRVFVIHGWGGSPGGGWKPWLKEELEARGFQVIMPQMPNPEFPKMDEWVGTLASLVGKPEKGREDRRRCPRRRAGNGHRYPGNKEFLPAEVVQMGGNKAALRKIHHHKLGQRLLHPS